MSTTVGSLILRSRAHHPAFRSFENHSNQVCLSFLSTRQQELLKILSSGSLKDRFSQARKIADTIAAALVGVDAAGAAFSVVTSGDAYGIVIGADGIPYLDTVKLSTDPNAAGFPLPTSSLHIISIYATIALTFEQVEVIVLPQRELPHRTGVGWNLYATINGWRLLPLRNPSPTAALPDPTAWTKVAYVTISWVDTPVRFTEALAAWDAQLFTVPDVYCDVFEYELAAHLARREYGRDPKNFPANLAAMFTEQANNAAGRITAQDVELRGVQRKRVRRIR